VAHSRGSRFPRTSASRRATSWEGSPEGASGTLSASSSFVFGTAQQAAIAGLTIVRWRGSFTAGLITASAAGHGFDCALGLGIVSENASGIGITAIPTPIADQAWDGWLFHKTFQLFTAFGTTMDPAGIMMNVRFDLDSKAMRKFKQTDVLVGVLEVVETGTATMRSFLAGRTLVKLS